MVAALPRALAWPRGVWPVPERARAVATRLHLMLSEELGQAPLFLPVALGLGIALYFVPLEEPPAWLGAALLLAAFTLLVLAWRWPVPSLLAGQVLAVALGFALVQFRAQTAPPMPDLPTRAVLLEARVASVEPLPDGRRVTLAEPSWRTEAEGTAGSTTRTLRLRLRTTEATPIAAGDRVALRALLRPPGAPVEPGAFDFQRAAFFAGQAGSVQPLGPVRVLQASGEAAWAEGAIARLRQFVIARVAAAQPAREAAVSTALLAGTQTAIGAEDAQAMRDSGLAHLLSVSGLHIAIVMGVTVYCLRLALALVPYLALRLPVKTIGLLGGLAVGGFYMVLTGSEVPMQRSFAMAALVALAIMAGRNPLSLRTLAVAAGAILLLLPHVLLGASFQMSFAAVLALIVGFAVLRPYLTQAPRDSGPAWHAFVFVLALLLSSTLAGLATTPFGMFHFQRASLYGVAANALAVPVTSFVVMPLGMLAFVLMPFGLDWLALVPMGWGVQAILWVAHLVAGWPGAALALPAMPPWGFGLCVLGLLLMGLLCTPLRWLGAPLFVAGLLSPALHVPPAVLVSNDARLIAVHHDGALHLLRAPGGSSFALETWRRRAGEPPVVPLACAPPYCRLGDVAVVPQGPMPRGLCGAVPVIVSPEPLRFACTRSLVIDRFDVWRDGAHAVRFTDGHATVESDRQHRGARLWVPPRPRPRGANPPALRE